MTTFLTRFYASPRRHGLTNPRASRPGGAARGCGGGGSTCLSLQAS